MSRKFLISLVRHGETMENRQKIMQGQLDTKLSDLGNKQAQLLAMRLKNDKFTYMFSSDLARAADTARAIVEANKSFAAELILDRRLRERGFGNLEGKLLPEYRKAAELAKVPMQDYTPDGGETVQQVTARAKDFYEELCRLMAEPLLGVKGGSLGGLGNSRGPHDVCCSQQQVTSAGQVCMQEAERRDAEPPRALRIDIPNCFQPPKPELDAAHGNHESTAGSHTGTSPGDCHMGSCASKQQGFTSIPDSSVLIVSHGLLLRELKRLILGCYSGKLEGHLAKEASIICSNTGLSQFGMSVSVEGSRVETKCEHIYVINDTQHLVSSSEDLISAAKFQGAL